MGKQLTYSLNLANGQRWQIADNEGAAEHIAKLAEAMHLGVATGADTSPKVILWHGGLLPLSPVLNTPLSGQIEILEELPADGWRCQFLIKLHYWTHELTNDSIIEFLPGDRPDAAGMRLIHIPIYNRAMRSGGLPMHAGLVELNGAGCLLSGPSNSGKSTCCFRLPEPWHVLCDEDTLVVLDKQQRYVGHPFPTWSRFCEQQRPGGWNTGHHVPVSAIFFLEQALEDECIPLKNGEAAVLISQSAWENCFRSWRHLDRRKAWLNQKQLYDNACALAKAVPTFRLRVTLSGMFWQKMEEVLSRSLGDSCGLTRGPFTDPCVLPKGLRREMNRPNVRYASSAGPSMEPGHLKEQNSV